MEAKEYFEVLGGLVSGMQSLEFILRGFLFNDEIAKGKAFPKMDFNKLNQGDVVSLNSFTNYDSLGELIRKYNSNPRIISAGLTVDETLVRLRDTIAHGRVSSSEPSDDMILLKFSRPDDNSVKVEFSERMTEDWFKTQIKRANEAVLNVVKANKKLQNGEL